MEAIEKDICGFKCYDMQPVYEVVEYIPMLVRNKPYISKSYYRKGLAKYIGPDGVVHISDMTSIQDYGPDGVESSFTRVPDVMPSLEECMKGQEYVMEIAVQALISQGIW